LVTRQSLFSCGDNPSQFTYGDTDSVFPPLFKVVPPSPGKLTRFTVFREVDPSTIKVLPCASFAVSCYDGHFSAVRDQRVSQDGRSVLVLTFALISKTPFTPELVECSPPPR